LPPNPNPTKILPLDGLKFTLPRVILDTTFKSDKLGTKCLEIWMPEIKQQIPSMLSGVNIIGFQLLGGLLDLYAIPAKEYHKGGNILVGLGLGGKAFMQKLAVQVLTLGSKTTITVQQIISVADQIVSGTNAKPNDISHYANQPTTLYEGVTDAGTTLLNGLQSAVNAITIEPYNEFQRNGLMGLTVQFTRGLLAVAPRVAGGAIGGATKLLQATSNAVDPSHADKSHVKYKNPEFIIYSIQTPDLVLDIEGGSTQSGAYLTISPYCNGNESQRFRINDIGIITNVKSGLVLGVETNPGVNPGNKIIQTSATGNSNQRWKLQYQGNICLHEHPDLVIDIERGSSNIGAKCILSQWKYATSQKWNVKQISFM